MLFILIIITLILVSFGLSLLLITSNQKKRFGILTQKRIYQDTQEKPGELLFSQSLPLIGKPDYLIKQGEIIIPVEVKMGKTPKIAYDNHIMQLMAYCFLVEENYHIRPPGGYLRYREKEFQFKYTKEAEVSVRVLVNEMIHIKENNIEQYCSHPEHNK